MMKTCTTIIEMSPTSYLFSISRMNEAADLHAVRSEIMADGSLDDAEKEELMASVNRRFGQLNLEASAGSTGLTTRGGRWK